MGATVRAKFKCVVVEDYGMSKRVKLSAVTATAASDDENKSFNRYTPAGELWMTIDNPKASIVFEPNKSYYLDFTPAE